MPWEVPRVKQATVGAPAPRPGDRVSHIAAGLSEDILRDAIEAGWVESLRCTRNDPPTYAGLTIYARSTRRLRELLASAGWRPDNSDHYCTTASEDGRVRVLVAAGDACTGTTAIPCTRSTRGPHTRDAIEENSLQLALFEGFTVKPPSLDEDVIAAGPCSTWMLLHYVDTIATETRLELSLPVAMDEAGHVERWLRRIVLRPIPHQLRVDLDGEGDGGDADFRIEKRPE